MVRFLVFVMVVGCKGSPEPEPQPTSVPPSCNIGSEDCACTGGGACDQGLACEMDVCVVPSCPIGSLDCPCTEGDACDPGLTCHQDSCLPTPECGDGILDFDEECDDGNTTTEACLYGDASCEVCSSECALVAGATSVCGDGDTDATHEDCDVPGQGSFCDYGLSSCQVCTPSCTAVAGTTRTCGDGSWDSPYEDCDGAFYCDSSCAYVGEIYEYNDDIGDAVELQALGDGSFSHPLDMVHGPGFDSTLLVFESPDYFEIEVCAGGTITARIDFENAQGSLDLLLGRREGYGTTGPPPVYFNWESNAVAQDFQEIVLDSPTLKTHWIKVRAHEASNTYLFNTYTLTGSISCP